ncbi:MAG: protein kinase [Gammaproteobacteria bacterium]|nr:protein kinase [Gammaproteobacteria bacterium]
MELITGGDRERPAREQALEVKEAFRIIREIARALDFAHSKGFIHRDIKPENILFREEGSAVLSDFGIARGMDNETQITTMGSVVGTPYYMSPEQVTGEQLDGRADLYSLGVVFYKMLTGKVPYDGDSALNIGIRHIKDPVPKLPSRLSRLQPLIDRFMAKAPAHRFQSGAEVIEELDRFERSSSMPSSVAKTEVLGADLVNEIKRSTGQSKTRSGSRPSVTRVMQVGKKRASPVKFLVVGVSLALIIGGAAWFLLQAREGPAPVPETSEETVGVSRGGGIGAGGHRVPARAGARAARERDFANSAEGNALDVYRQALALAPDSEAARAGVEAVGRALAEEGSELLEQGDAAAARERLELAEELPRRYPGSVRPGRCAGSPGGIGIARAAHPRADRRRQFDHAGRRERGGAGPPRAGRSYRSVRATA